jgi:hypothetical protein
MYFCPQDKNILPPLRSEQALGTRGCLNFLKLMIMGIINAKEDEKFTCPIRTRVDQTTFNRLENMLIKSDCQTIGELARKLITREKINIFYKDITMNAPMEELVSIRKELKSIGININQLTRSFNQEKSRESERQYYVLQVAELYKKVDGKVETLLTIVAKLTERWLQKY